MRLTQTNCGDREKKRTLEKESITFS